MPVHGKVEDRKSLPTTRREANAHAGYGEGGPRGMRAA